MEFMVDRDKVLACLSTVSRAVSSKAVNPILGTILIEAQEGKVTFRGVSSAAEVTMSCPADVTKEGACCVDAIVANLISSFDVGEIKFKQGKRLSITQGKRRHQPVFVDPTDFPDKLVKEDYVPIDGKKFVNALTRCGIAGGDVSGRPVLEGYLIDPEQNFILAGDGSQIALYQDIELVGEKASPSIKALGGFLSTIGSGENLEVSFGAWSGFRAEGWEILVNSIEGEFPAIAKDAVLNTLAEEPPLKIKFSKSELERALGVCVLYSSRALKDGKQHHTVFSLKGGEASLSMDITDFSEMKEPLETFESEGLDEFEIWFSPKDLLEGIGQISAPTVEIRFFEPLPTNSLPRPFLVLDEADPNYTYLQVAMALPKSIRDERKQEVEVEEKVDF